MFNSLAFARVEVVNLTLSAGGGCSVLNSNLQPVATQIDAGICYFIANAPAGGFATYYFNESALAQPTPAPVVVPVSTSSATFVLSNANYNLTFSSGTGQLLNVLNVVSGFSMALRQDVAVYINGTGGAYVR